MKNFKINEVLGLILLAGYALIHFALPTSFWFTVDLFDVQDTIKGQPIIVDYERTINRPYVADWRIRVRRDTGDGFVQVCSSDTHRQDYDPDNRLPEPVTLEWLAFTDPYCYDLPPGDYLISIAWDINPTMPGAILLSRSARISDRFSVVAP